MSATGGRDNRASKIDRRIAAVKWKAENERSENHGNRHRSLVYRQQLSYHHKR